MKNTIIISLGCLICFVGRLYLGVTKVEEQTAKWDVKYKETDDKVSAFVEVSDPNTVRSYIKQLNDMLDNMSRLGKIIESGQELDNALIDILNQQQKLNKKLGDMVTLEEYKAYTVQNDFRLGASKHDDDDQYDLIEELSSDLDKINNNFNKKIKKIEVGLADIKSDLNKIKNSKMGSKLLGD